MNAALGHLARDFVPGLRMQLQIGVQRVGSGLAGVIVRRGSDTAATKYYVVRAKTLPERPFQRGAIIGKELCPHKGQAALPKNRDDMGKMAVTASAGQDLIANDIQSKSRQSPLPIARRAGAAVR